MKADTPISGDAAIEAMFRHLADRDDGKDEPLYKPPKPEKWRMRRLKNTLFGVVEVPWTTEDEYRAGRRKPFDWDTERTPNMRVLRLYGIDRKRILEWCKDIRRRHEQKEHELGRNGPRRRVIWNDLLYAPDDRQEQRDPVLMSRSERCGRKLSIVISNWDGELTERYGEWPS